MAMTVGMVGWRGMVGSVLMQRMQQENDFSLIDPVFFSTSNVGGDAPLGGERLKDAMSIDELKRMDTIITCQGGDYTTEVFGRLRAAGWKGYWIDAASTLRMKDESVIILDPLNLGVIQQALAKGGRDFIGVFAADRDRAAKRKVCGRGGGSGPRDAGKMDAIRLCQRRPRYLMRSKSTAMHRDSLFIHRKIRGPFLAEGIRQRTETKKPQCDQQSTHQRHEVWKQRAKEHRPASQESENRHSQSQIGR